jgi:hypothetical protein
MGTAAQQLDLAGDHIPATTSRIYEIADQVLVATVERSRTSQLRVYLLRMVCQYRRIDRPPEHVNISIGRWFKDNLGDVWRSDRKAWKGGPLLFPSEVPLIAAALQRAVEIAAERGWRLR